MTKEEESHKDLIRSYTRSAMIDMLIQVKALSTNNFLLMSLDLDEEEQRQKVRYHLRVAVRWYLEEYLLGEGIGISIILDDEHYGTYLIKVHECV